MKRVILLIILSISINTISKAQIWRGFGKGLGIGTDVWHNTDNKSDFTNINLSGVFTLFNENTIIAPSVSFGQTEDGSTYYKNKPVTNNMFLWEFSTAVLFQVGRHVHIGPKAGAMLIYNHYESFSAKDEWIINGGLEMQINLNDNYRSPSNNAIYINATLHSFGIGFRHYIF